MKIFPKFRKKPSRSSQNPLAGSTPPEIPENPMGEGPSSLGDEDLESSLSGVRDVRKDEKLDQEISEDPGGGPAGASDISWISGGRPRFSEGEVVAISPDVRFPREWPSLKGVKGVLKNKPPFKLIPRQIGVVYYHAPKGPKALIVSFLDSRGVSHLMEMSPDQLTSVRRYEPDDYVMVNALADSYSDRYSEMILPCAIYDDVSTSIEPGHIGIIIRAGLTALVSFRIPSSWHREGYEDIIAQVPTHFLRRELYDGCSFEFSSNYVEKIYKETENNLDEIRKRLRKDIEKDRAERICI